MTEPAARPSQTGRWLTLLVTNAIKLGGLWIAVHEIATQTQPRIAEMGVAIFMMAGAQVSEETILGLAGRMFGGHPAEHTHEDPKR